MYDIFICRVFKFMCMDTYKELNRVDFVYCYMYFVARHGQGVTVKYFHMSCYVTSRHSALYVLSEIM